MNATDNVRSSAGLEESNHVRLQSTAAQTVVRRHTSNGTAKPTAVPGPTTVVIQVGATDSGMWADETPSAAETVDCAVHVALQGPQEVKQQAPGAKTTRRWWIKRLMLALLVLGSICSAILVPYSLVVGFNTSMPREFKVLTHTAPAHKIIFAFTGNNIYATPDRIVPTLAKQVTQWSVLASSGVHVATLSSRQAMQQAMAVLANTANIKYAVTDFQLLPDRRASSISNPTQLLDLSRLQPEQRRRLQAQQHNSQEQRQQLANGDAVAAMQHGLYSSGLKATQVSKLVATHMQRLAQRKAKRHQLLLSQPSLASIGVPATAQDLRIWADMLQQESQAETGPENQLQQRWQQQASVTTRTQHLLLAMNEGTTDAHADDSGQASTTAEAAGVPHSTSSAEGSSTRQEYISGAKACKRHIAGWADVTFSTTASATAMQEAAASTGQFPGTAAAAAAVASAEQLLVFKTQRYLQQYQPPPPPPQPQPQQRQAFVHPQKGGKGVAWHLTDAELHMKQAWNTTYGLDDVLVAVVDSGVELSQGGVGASVWINSGEVVADNIDNDGNGFVDDVMGWDFGGSCADAACSYCTPGPDPTDTTGWGTHAASVIAAQPEVTTGAAGIAPGVRVMALKVSDCRAGSILGDAVAQQLDLAPHIPVADLAASPAGPLLLGSAAVAAIDYALLNGAHIVLAAWQAGGLIDSVGQADSSSAPGGAKNDSGSDISAPGAKGEAASEQGRQQQQQGLDCVLGGASAAEANATLNCLADVQTLLFQDVLRPLEEAGVLVVTMHPDEDNSSSSMSPSNGTHPAAPVLPCSLGLEMPNVLCVSSSRSVEESTAAVASSVSAQSYFDILINTLSAHMPDLGNSMATNSTDSNMTSSAEDEVALPDYFSNDSDEPLPNPDQESNTITDITGVVRTLLSHNPVQLTAPGINIISGWAWGSHAVVSGGSAAAAVAAGAAALTWSNLGQTLGAEAAGAAAVEGLAKLVKHMLIAGSGKSGSSGSSSQSAGTGEGVLMEQVAASASSGGGAAGELNLLGTLKMSSAYTGPLRLKAAHIGPAVTAVSNTLSYSWHISSLDSGPFNTPAMSFVARKALNHEAPFPLRDWEFFGYTALVEVEGYVVVSSPGNYSIAVMSEDKFIMWLQGKWLRMDSAGSAGPSMRLNPRAWTATVLFSEPGYYHLRIIIYMPSLSSFDLLWQPPGSASFVHIPHFASFGRTQPKPLQIADQITGHMLMHGSRARSGGSSMISSRVSSEYSGSSTNPAPTSTADGSSAGSVMVTQPADVTSEPGSPASAGPRDDGMQPGAASSPVTDSSDGSFEAVQTYPSSYDHMDTVAATTAVVAATPENQEEQQQQQQQQADSSDDSNAGGVAYSAPRYGSSSGWGGWGGGSSGWGSSFGNFFDMLFPGFGWSTEKGKGPAAEMLPDQNEAVLHSSLEYDSRGDASSRDGSSASGSMLSSSDAGPGGNSSARNHRTHSHDSSQAAMPHQQQQQQQPPWHPSSLRSLLSTHWINPVVDKQVVSPLPGVFSVAMTLEEPWAYRTIIPSLTNLNLRRTAILPGPGLEIADGSVLQQQLFGQIDPLDDRSGYGVIQGWLSWEKLNPSALQWLQGFTGDVNVGTMGVNPNIDTGEWGVLDGVQASRAGVQFELICGGAGVQQGCSLHVDGLIVAGSLGQLTYSTCIMPAHRPFGSVGTSASAPEQLLHLELLFATDAVRLTTLSVKSRPCALAGDGTVQLSSGSDGSFTVVTATAGASALGVESAAIASLGDADVSGGYLRGMACTVRATVPADSSSGGTSTLEKLVFLTAEEMQRAVATRYNLTAAEEQLTGEAAAAAAASSSSEGTDSRATEWFSNRTDTIASINATADGNDSNSTEASGDHSEWMPEVDTHAEVTTKAVLGVKGITVAQLAPQWVATLPTDTTYSFTCGCYWNGSWEGNVAVSVRAGSSGTAAMYLAGWPVDVAHLLPQYGPSDIYTPDYSTWQQRQQLASGSNAADSVNWASDSPGRGLGLTGLGIASEPGAAAKLGFRPKQLLDGHLFTLGQVNGVRNFEVPSGSGWHQLLVVQGEGLQAWGSVVVVADVPGAEDISSSNSSRPYAATKQGWLPGEWDAWVPR